MEGHSGKSQTLFPCVIMAEKHKSVSTSFKCSQHDDTVYLNYAFKADFALVVNLILHPGFPLEQLL